MKTITLFLLLSVSSIASTYVDAPGKTVTITRITSQTPTCKDGTCPLIQATRNVITSIKHPTYTYVQPIQTTYTYSYSEPIVEKQTIRTKTHYTHPGDISSHLMQSHGRSVAGMSLEEQLTLHDSLHQGVSSSYSSYSRRTFGTPIRSFFRRLLNR